MSEASEEPRAVVLPHACEQLAAAMTDLQCGVQYSPWNRAYSVRRKDGWGEGIAFCPFCGAALPPSLGDEFWERYPDADDPPLGPDGDRWWREDPVLGAMPLTVVMVEGTPRFDRALHPVEAGVVEALSRAAFGRVFSAGLLTAPRVRATGVGIDVVVPSPPPADPAARRLEVQAATDDFFAIMEVAGDVVVSLWVTQQGPPATTASLPDASWEVLAVSPVPDVVDPDHG